MVKTTREVSKQEIRPQMEASEADLVDIYNAQARSVNSLRATVGLMPSTGSTYSGVIEEYHAVPGFIVAEKPAMVRVIGQAPVVGTNIFDMVSDGQTFRIFIPSRNRFLVGSTSVIRSSNKPIENLRPQHIIDALFWQELPADANVLLEQYDADPSRYYVLTVLRQREGSKFELDRKIWFDRADLGVARLQLYGPSGRLDADISYWDWQPIAQAAGQAQAWEASFPNNVKIWRPQDDYRLEIHITKLTINQPVSTDQFDLPQPSGTQLVHLGEETIG